MHKKYIRKNGKTFGPYLYESKRVGDKVTTNYVGKNRREFKRFFFPFIVVFLLGIFIGVAVVYMFFPPHLTGKVVLDLKPSYAAGESLSGSLKVTLQEGELLPADSIARITVGKMQKQALLSQLVKGPTTQGSFYIRGLRLRGTGEGYGIPGTFSGLPSVSFKLSIANAGSSSSGSTSNQASADAAQEENDETESHGGATGDGGDTSGGKGSGSFVANVIRDLEIGSEGFSTNALVSGSTREDAPFTYAVSSNTEVSLVPGSVSVGGRALPDSAVTVRKRGGDVIVTTSYTAEQSGFGSSYIGDSTMDVSLDLSEFDVELDHSVPFSLELYHEGQLILQARRNLVVEDSAETISVNVDTSRERIILGRPVTWTKHISFSDPATLTVRLPEGARDVSILSSEEASVRTDDHVTIITSGDDTEVSVQVGGSMVEPRHVATEQHKESIGQGDIVHNEVQVVAPSAEGTTETTVVREAQGLIRGISGRVVTDVNAAENVLEITDAVNAVTIQYTTGAVFSTEAPLPRGKEATITSPEGVHYNDILVYTSLPEYLRIRNPSSVSIYSHDDRAFVAPESVQDVDNDGTYDYIEWVVPHLSTHIYTLSAIAADFSTGTAQAVFAQSCMLEQESPTSHSYAALCSGTYPAPCGQDLLSCRDSLTEAPLYGPATYGGISVETYNRSITDCRAIQSVAICHSVWSGQLGTGSIEVGRGSTFASVTPVLIVPSPAVTCTNVTHLLPWTCSDFFGPAASGAKARVEVAGEGGPEAVQIDALYFNVSYSQATDVEGCTILDTPHKIYTQSEDIIPSGGNACIRIGAPNVTFVGNGYSIANTAYTGVAIYSNFSDTRLIDVNVSISTDVRNGGRAVSFEGASRSLIQDSDLSSAEGVMIVSSDNTVVNWTKILSYGTGISFANAPRARVANSEITGAGADHYGIALDNSPNFTLSSSTVQVGDIGDGLPLGGVRVHFSNNSALVNSVVQGQAQRGVSIESSRNAYVASSSLSGEWYATSLYIDGVASVNSTIFNSSVVNSVLSDTTFYDVVWATESINRTTFIDTPIQGYSFTGVGGTIIVKRSGYGQVAFLRSVNGSGNLAQDIILGNNSAFITSDRPGFNRAANITLYSLHSDYRSVSLLRNGVACSASICRNFTAMPAQTIIFNATQPGNYSAGILSCFENNFCTEGSGCSITNACYLNNGRCTGGVCDFTNFTISAPLYTGVAGVRGDDLTMYISDKITFLPGNKIDFSGIEGPTGGNGGTLNITTSGLFNRTNAVLRGVGGYSNAPLAIGGSGGRIYLHYRGLIGTSFTWNVNLGGNNSVSSGPGTSGTIGLYKSLDCPRDADINGDGVIDVFDILSVINTYSNVSSDITFDRYTDLDCSGKINVIDLAASTFELDRGAD